MQCPLGMIRLFDENTNHKQAILRGDGSNVSINKHRILKSSPFILSLYNFFKRSPCTRYFFKNAVEAANYTKKKDGKRIF
jgi:hypothetical protein